MNTVFFRTLKWLLKDAFSFSKKYFLYCVLFISIYSALPFANIYIPQIIIDLIVSGRELAQIMIWVFVMTGMNFIGAGVLSYLTYKMKHIEDAFSDKCRIRLGDAAVKMEYKYVESDESLDNLEKATRGMFWYSGGLQRVMGSVISIVSNLITVTGIVILLISMKQFYTLFVGGLILIEIVVIFFNNKFDLGFFKKMNKYNREFRYYTGILENFSFGKEIRLYKAQDLILSHIRDYQVYSDLIFKRKAKFKSLTGLIDAIIFMILQVSMYANICYQVFMRVISIGSFTLFANAYINFVTKTTQIFSNTFELKKNITLISDYYDFIERYKRSDEQTKKADNKAENDRNIIEFKNVYFSYPNSDKVILKNINIQISSDEKISIVGRNGAGKTTFIKLLIGLYKPTQGQILLNGVDIKNINIETYQQKMATVFQDFQIYSATLKENICMDSQVDQETYREALINVGLDKMVGKLPSGDNTILGKQFALDGQELSGGQKQRIAIARAMCKNSHFLILDEPTAALDVRMEYEIYRQVHEWDKPCAMIFISHRLSSCTFCSRVLVFDNGEIIQDGHHKELIVDKDKLYYKLFNSQAKYYVE